MYRFAYILKETEGIEYRVIVKNVFKHIKLVLKHKYKVFIFCCKIGMPFRGFMHDWSKFSPTEFWESVKYYNGKRSPIALAKENSGYSKAWLHHKGRNKHHYEYWYDYRAPEPTPIMPYKYTAEMICDKLSASMTYKGKEWTNKEPLEYWKNKEVETAKINPKIKSMLTEVFEKVAEKGIDKVITKKNLKELYKKHCIEEGENKWE